MRLSEIRQGQQPKTERESLAGLERVLHLTYSTQNGESRQAALTVRLLNTSARIGRDIACARLAAPLPYDKLGTAAQLRVWAYATLAYAIIEPPAWLEEALEYDETLTFQLYEEVARHERAYFRADVAEGEGEARGPRVELRALDAPQA